MSLTLAILTSDPNLLRCQVDLLKARLHAGGPFTPGSMGLGYVEADNILLRKKPAGGEPALSELVADVGSEVLFLHAGPLPSRTFADEDAMPLRFRRWMFMHEAPLGSTSGSYSRLWDSLPDFLRRQAKGTSASELLFLSFVRRLRDEGRCDDFDVPPSLVGRLLAETIGEVEAYEREAGKVGNLGVYVTNGRVMAATRRNSGPLHYALLEGIARCERCSLDETTPDSNPLLRSHRRVRAVALSPQAHPEGGFLEVPEGSLVTVGHNLDVQVLPLADCCG
jgi:glutamine amidotransferase